MWTVAGPFPSNFGASPDGISDEYAIEIKGPLKEKKVSLYIKDGKPGLKCHAQLQIQMHFAKIKRAFCALLNQTLKSETKFLLYMFPMTNLLSLI